jgi:hypothetical protein
MTSATRLYALVLAVLVFFLAWAAVAARPWAAESGPAPADPRVAQLAAREERLREQGAEVQRIIDARWGAYERALSTRERQIDAAELPTARKKQKRLDRIAAAEQGPAQQAPAPAPPQVEIVELPPITQSASS